MMQMQLSVKEKRPKPSMADDEIDKKGLNQRKVAIGYVNASFDKRQGFECNRDDRMKLSVSIGLKLKRARYFKYLPSC